MTKLIPLIVMILILTCCATIPVKPITEEDIRDLKGEWPGVRYGVGYTAQTNLMIDNDKLPLQGKIIWHGTTAGTVPWHFANGAIENGHLVLFWDKERWMNLRLRKGEGKMKLEGDYRAWQWTGTVSFEKVQN